MMTSRVRAYQDDRSVSRVESHGVASSCNDLNTIKGLIISKSLVCLWKNLTKVRDLGYQHHTRFQPKLG